MSKRETAIEALAGVDFFAGVDRSILEELAASAQERRYAAGQTIFLRGDRGDGMFIVGEGRVRISVVSAEGRELALRHAEPGSVFGEIALLDEGPRSADATAVQNTLVFVVPLSRFRQLRERTAGLDRAIVRGLCERLRGTTDQLEAIALLPLEVRLARLFVQFAKASGAAGARVRLPLEISQGELASLIGASRPKVNQVLSAWQDGGTVTRSPGALVLDMESLRDVAQLEAE